MAKSETAQLFKPLRTSVFETLRTQPTSWEAAWGARHHDVPLYHTLSSLKEDELEQTK